MEAIDPIQASDIRSCFSLASLRRSLSQASFLATSPSSSSLQPTYVAAEHDELSSHTPPRRPSSSTPDTSRTVSSPTSNSMVSTNIHSTEDDLAAKSDPSRHVDYLSHDWREEDVCSSWRHITLNRKIHGRVSRLENASWRAWAKSRFRLPTVLPETLDWFKECDITWLYGPLQESTNSFTDHAPETSEYALKDNARTNQRSILKKHGMLEVMMRRSISSPSVLSYAAAAAQMEEPGVSMDRKPDLPGRMCSHSDLFSLSVPPKVSNMEATNGFTPQPIPHLHEARNMEKRHIRFNEIVEQRITLESKDDVHHHHFRPSHSDLNHLRDDGIAMKMGSRHHRCRHNPQHSLPRKGDVRRPEKVETIAKLPDTMLRWRADSS